MSSSSLAHLSQNEIFLSFPFISVLALPNYISLIRVLISSNNCRELYGSLPDVVVPLMYIDKTTQKVLIMEWVDVNFFLLPLIAFYLVSSYALLSN